jgi:hypothetical protein
MAEEHQHEQKQRRIGQILDKAVQRQQQQIADQAAKHVSRLLFAAPADARPELGEPGELVHRRSAWTAHTAMGDHLEFRGHSTATLAGPLNPGRTARREQS